MKKFLPAATGLLALGILVGRVLAQGIPTPMPLNVTGEIDEGGVLVDGSRQVGAALFDAPVAGTQLCQVAPSPIPVVRGRFTVPLADACTDAVAGAADAWVEVTVDGTPFPRRKLGAVPYAVVAAQAHTAAGALDGRLRALENAPVTALAAKPFLERFVQGNTSSTSLQVVATFNPLTTGNHLTPSEILIDGYCQGGTGNFAARIHYEDGTSYTTATYSTASPTRINLAQLDVPLHAALRGTVTRVELLASTNSSADTAAGRLRVSGLETASSGLTAAKPFIGRSVSGNSSASNYVTVATFAPLTSGNHLTPTNIQTLVSCQACTGYVRYALQYEDGTTYTSPESSASTSTLTTTSSTPLAIHPGMRGSVTSILLQARTNSAADTVTARIVVSGYETAP